MASSVHFDVCGISRGHKMLHFAHFIMIDSASFPSLAVSFKVTQMQSSSEPFRSHKHTAFGTSAYFLCHSSIRKKEMMRKKRQRNAVKRKHQQETTTCTIHVMLGAMTTTKNKEGEKNDKFLFSSKQTLPEYRNGVDDQKTCLTPMTLDIDFPHHVLKCSRSSAKDSFFQHLSENGERHNLLTDQK